jgi:hypothetical protein
MFSSVHSMFSPSLVPSFDVQLSIVQLSDVQWSERRAEPVNHIFVQGQLLCDVLKKISHYQVNPQLYKDGFNDN